MVSREVGASIPADTEHAVSVSLPTWKANVGYEEGEDWVVSKMETGYPRFFIHKSIQKLASAVLGSCGRPGERCMLFPSHDIATLCRRFIERHSPACPPPPVRVVDLVRQESGPGQDRSYPPSNLSAVFFPEGDSSVAKQFWQHSGEGVSSRRAEFCLGQLAEGRLVEKAVSENGIRTLVAKGPTRYSSNRSVDKGCTKLALESEALDGPSTSRFVEERFGRNLGFEFAGCAKPAVRKRIAGTPKSNVGLKDAIALSSEGSRDVEGFTEDDVYLYPTGMSAIFNSHQLVLRCVGSRESVCFGFPYIDTLKILQKFGPGCRFYGHVSSQDLDDLEERLERGLRPAALFCEFPGNPLLESPDLRRIRHLADKHDFVVVVDETIGNFLNVNVLPYADIVVSSLTKVFSGESNVMGGSIALNPKAPHYALLKKDLKTEYKDNLWVEDAIFLERNSRDFISRIQRINVNAEVVYNLLLSHPRVKQVYYPKNSESKANYDSCRRPDGGYGGLLSATFYTIEEASRFFDALATAKGPSLGTNFTLCSPYTLLAHYRELDWAASFGVETALVRASIGLEDTEELKATFERALAVLPMDKS